MLRNLTCEPNCLICPVDSSALTIFAPINCVEDCHRRCLSIVADPDSFCFAVATRYVVATDAGRVVLGVSNVTVAAFPGVYNSISPIPVFGFHGAALVATAARAARLCARWHRKGGLGESNRFLSECQS